ncbi:unnamed protein product [Calypogeia fissa]
MDWLPCDDASSREERSIGEDSCRTYGPNPCAPFPQVHVRLLQRENSQEFFNSCVPKIPCGSTISASFPKEVSPSSSPISPFGFGTTECERHSTDNEEEEEESAHHYRRRSYEISVASSSDTTYDLLNSFTNALSDCLQLTIKEAHVFSSSTQRVGNIALGRFVVMQEGHYCGSADCRNPEDPLEALRQGVLEILRILENLRGQSDSVSEWSQTTNPDFGRADSDAQSLQSEVEDLDFGDFSIDFKDLKIGARLGGGSSGDIHRGTYHMQNVAVKIITLAWDEDDDDDDLTDFSPTELLKTFRQEVSTMRLARHKNLIQFIGACSCWPKLYIVTELMLGNVWETRGPDSYALSNGNAAPNSAGGTSNSVDDDMTRSVQILRDAASGMDFLHRRGVMHRDLKGANLLVDDHGVVKVCDFGLAKSFNPTTTSKPRDSQMFRLDSCPTSCSDEADTMTGAVGTVKWMAPEVFAHKAYDHKADVYSFGIVIWEIVTGEVPYSGLTPRQAANGVVHEGLRPIMPTSIPPKLASLAEQCWDPNPQRRPEFCEIAAVLEELSLELSGSRMKKRSSVFRTVKSRWLFSRGG